MLHVFFSQDYVRSGTPRRTFTQEFDCVNEIEGREIIISFMNEMEESGWKPVGKPCVKTERR